MHQKSLEVAMREEENFIKLEEAAELLKTSTSTVRRWVRQGTLIAHRSDHGIRFCRKELDEWMKKAGMSCLKQSGSDRSANCQNTGLYDALGNGRFFRFENSISRDELYREIAELTAPNIAKPFSPDELFLKMVEREKTVPTTIMKGVAVPHPKRRGENLFNDSWVFPVILKHPIALNKSAEADTNILFFLFAADPAEHLKLLARLVKKITRTPDFISRFLNCDSMESLMDLLRSSDQ